MTDLVLGNDLLDSIAHLSPIRLGKSPRPSLNRANTVPGPDTLSLTGFNPDFSWQIKKQQIYKIFPGGSMAQNHAKLENAETSVQTTNSSPWAGASQEAQKEMLAQRGANDRIQKAEPTHLDFGNTEDIYRPQEKLSYSSEKRQFDELLQSHPGESAALKQNLADLESRLAGRPDGKQVTAEVLRSVNEMLKGSDSAVIQPKEKQAQVAEGILNHAAHPEEINQGFFNSCVFATIETEVYARQPGLAAKMVASITRTGKFTAHDGTNIEVDANSINKPFDTPNKNSEETKGRVALRDQASQIFQLAAFDLKLANGSDPPLEVTLRPPSIESPTGEFVGIKGKEEAPYMNRVLSKLPTMGDYEPTYERLTGQKSNGIVTLLDSANDSELHEILAKAKAEGRLPIAVSVNTSSDLVKDSLSEKASNDAANAGIGKHAMSIIDYDSDSQTVQYRNHYNGAKAEEIDTDDLYKAMTAPVMSQVQIDEFVADLTKLSQGHDIPSANLEAVIRLMHPSQRDIFTEKLGKSLGIDVRSRLSQTDKERLEID